MGTERRLVLRAARPLEDVTLAGEGMWSGKDGGTKTAPLSLQNCQGLLNSTVSSINDKRHPLCFRSLLPSVRSISKSPGTYARD